MLFDGLTSVVFLVFTMSDHMHQATRELCFLVSSQAHKQDFVIILMIVPSIIVIVFFIFLLLLLLRSSERIMQPGKR